MKQWMYSTYFPVRVSMTTIFTSDDELILPWFSVIEKGDEEGQVQRDCHLQNLHQGTKKLKDTSLPICTCIEVIQDAEDKILEAILCL